MKRFLALLLALTMLFSLAACGEKTPENNENNKENNNGGDELTSFVAGVSLADLDALLRVFSGDSSAEEMTGIKDIYLEVGATDNRGLLGLGANLANKQYDIDLHIGEAIVLSAPSLLDKNYGLSEDGLTSFMGGFMNSIVGGGSSAGSASSVLASLDTEAIAALVSKYYNKIIDELKKADGLTATSQGSNTVINGTLTPAGAATVIVNVLEALLADDDFYAILGPIRGVTPEEAKQNLLEGKPSSDELISQLTDMLTAYSLNAKLTNVKLNADNLPISGELYVSVNQEVQTDEVRLAEISIAIDTEKGTAHGYFKDEGNELVGFDIADGKMDIRFNIDGASGRVYMETSETSVKGYMEMNGEKMVELDVAISDTEMNFKLVIARSEYVVNIKTSGSTVTGTLTMDGQEMGKLVFDKNVSGSKTTYTVKTLTVNATTIDFSAAGICFYIDTDPSIPAVPSYTDISTLTQDDLSAIGEKFMEDNADLIEWIGQTFGGSAESDEIYDEYYNEY